MGLPIGFSKNGVVAEPQTGNQGFATIPLGAQGETGTADSFDFVPSVDGPDAVVDSAFSWGGSFQSGDANGLSMEGVEIGIAAPSDQDLFTGADGVAEAPVDHGLPAHLLKAPGDPGIDSFDF